ncbi:hypothetical protein [uncultured Gilliamella sp.]|nr:hypothetical protein [uncultured Gilliamella sp.]
MTKKLKLAAPSNLPERWLSARLDSLSDTLKPVFNNLAVSSPSKLAFFTP